MNSEQRDQVERSFEDLVKYDAQLQDAFDKNRESKHPLFFKNLENVQGDERDVMYISCTYGPLEIGGRVPQRFGPINAENGWRRLNVLFTRSKTRMHIYSSMLYSDILVSSASKRRVMAFKNFLEYAQTKRSHHPRLTSLDGENEFEVSVASALHNEGYECDYQVGVAGYYIDLAVRDPGNPGRFLVGVECDGATYHSAKSVRDRDRLRQEVLEERGWKIMRVWSTDWFTNPESQLNPILTALASLRTEPTEPVFHADEILDEAEQEALHIIDQSPELSLRDLLERFDQEVILKDQPETVPERKLLNEAMLEALVHHQPMTKQEFMEEIPQYLRQTASPPNGPFSVQCCKYIPVSSSLISDLSAIGLEYGH